MFTSYNVVANPSGWVLDYGWSFIIDNNDKMFYALGEDLSKIQLKSDRIVLTHETGAWGMQYQGSRTNLTDFADTGNDFITTFNNNASIGTISNNTVYWPSDSYTPKYVNVTTSGEVKILAANFKEDLTAFNAASPPQVYIDKSISQIIVKSNHTVAATTIELSFQEAVDTGELNDMGVAFLLLFIICGFLLIIYLVVKRK